jgi:hypothetical protein
MKRKLLLKLYIEPFIVSIEKCDDVASTDTNANVTRLRRASVALGKYANRISKSARNHTCMIGAAIIDHQNFVRRDGLLQYGTDGARNTVFCVISGNNNADQKVPLHSESAPRNLPRTRFFRDGRGTAGPGLRIASKP